MADPTRSGDIAGGYYRPAAPDAPRQSDGAAAFGITLIVLGAVFLAARFVPGLVWWQLWPLLIVVGGLVQAVVPGRWWGWSFDRFLDGLGTALFGMVLLGNTTGYVSWTAWLSFAFMWPWLLIAAGVGIIGHATRQGWIRLIGTLIVWSVLVSAVAASWTGVPLPAFTGLTLFIR